MCGEVKKKKLKKWAERVFIQMYPGECGPSGAQ